MAGEAKSSLRCAEECAGEGVYYGEEEVSNHAKSQKGVSQKVCSSLWGKMQAKHNGVPLTY